jgi:hypothetical protein
VLGFSLIFVRITVCSSTAVDVMTTVKNSEVEAPHFMGLCLPINCTSLWNPKAHYHFHTRMAVIWAVAPCSLVEVHRRFRGLDLLIFLMTEAAKTSETLVNFYQTTRRYNPENCHLRAHCRENLKSYLRLIQFTSC